MKILGGEFYARPATETAPALLGKYLCVRDGGRVLRRRITETECYFGEGDTACHARRGRTARNAVMYSAGGVCYVYLCYGIHFMLNVVTGAEGHPEAVLIRGAEDAAGPGLVTKLFGIGRDFNGEDLRGGGRIWLEEEEGGESARYEALPRVGIGYASEADRARPWRYRALGVR